MNNLKIYYILTLIGIVLCGTQTFAQCTQDIILSSQADVDAFPTNYACTIVEGNLDISGEDIVDLTPLNSLVEVDGHFSISGNPILTSLEGLINLEWARDFSISDNNALVSLDGLSNLNNVHDYFTIIGNDALENLDGIADAGAWFFEVINNDGLTHINGFDSFLAFDFTLSGNGNLIEFDATGLKVASTDSYTSITGNSSLEIIKNGQRFESEYTTISNNAALTTITNCKFEAFGPGDVRIRNNPNLQTIDAFIEGGLELKNNPLLEDIDIDMYLSNVTRSLIIENNDALTSLEGFDFYLNNVDIIITENDVLNDINALSTINLIEDFTLTNNVSLSNCCVIPCILERIEEDITINGNLINCTSLEDINDNCTEDYCEGLANPIFELELRVFLEGATDNSSQMNAGLVDFAPLTQPYDEAPYNYEGTETLNGFSQYGVDWVLVEIRSGTPYLTEANTTVVETKACILLRSGLVRDFNNFNELRIENLKWGEAYHIVIRHRNHLDIISNTPIEAKGIIEYDFSDSVEQAFGTGQQKILENGKAGMIGGDYTQDGIIQITDYDLWKENPAQNNVYSVTDGTLDGIVQNTDADAWRPNKAKIGVIEIQF